MMQRVMFSLMLVVFLVGCGRAYFVHEPIDLVNSTQVVGSVLFECTGLEDPTEVIGHYIVIDDRPAIYVEAASKLRVSIEAGRHELHIVSVGARVKPFYKEGGAPDKDKVYKYGKPAVASLFMVEGGAAIVRYKAPAAKDGTGQILVL
jgi:hypothetical protein